MFNKTNLASLFILIVVIFSLIEAHPRSRSCNRPCSKRIGHQSRSNDWRFAQDSRSEDSISDEILLQQFGIGPVVASGVLRSSRVKNQSPELIDEDASDDLSGDLDVSDEDWALRNIKSEKRRCGCRNNCGCGRH